MEIKNRFLFIGITLLVILNGCQNTSISSDDQLEGTISISGAFALYPMTTRWAEEFQKIHPNVRIDVSAGGAGKGMTDALSGMVDLGMFSREVSIEEEKKGAWKIALTKDAVLPTINSHNPALNYIKEKGINRETFESVFIAQDLTEWGKVTGLNKSEESLTVYTRSDACGAAEMWAMFLGGTQETLKGIGVFGDPGMAEAVKKDMYGIGYNNVIYVYDIQTRKKYEGMEVIPIDINNNGMIDPIEDFYDSLDEVMNAIKDGRYPSPPARDLYFVSKGKPQNELVITFIKWILTDGQKYVNEAGYVQLSKNKIDAELEKINK